MRKYTKRSVALVTAGVVAVGGAGAAYAAWLLGGGGSASATASTSQGLTLADINETGNATDNVTVSPAFFPGSTNDVAFTVENPNPFPVRITGINLTVGTSTNEPTCLAGNVTVNSAAPLPAAATLVVPAKSGNTNGSAPITYVGALSMIENAHDDCQGAAFPITVALAANSGTTPAN